MYMYVLRCAGVGDPGTCTRYKVLRQRVKVANLHYL